MSETKKRLFSGMQPTSDSLHLGNYLGALKQWVELQDEYEAIYSVVDLHSLTVGPDPQVMRERTRRTAAQFLAGGVDPSRSILFVQSHVPEHTRLAWLLNCITGFGEASRMTQFKDKSAKIGNTNVTVGLFDYPILMAADILLYDAALVPVGEDQRQHLELSRHLAERLNNRYGQGTVVVPDGYIVKKTAKIYDLKDPEAKMSKSAAGLSGVLELLDEPKTLAKKVKSATTDSDTVIAYDPEKKAGISNLLVIYSALTGRPIEQLVADYEGKMYGHLKADLADVVVETFTPFRDRVMEYLADPAQLDAILTDGAARAQEIASPIYQRIARSFGLLPAR